MQKNIFAQLNVQQKAPIIGASRKCGKATIALQKYSLASGQNN